MTALVRAAAGKMTQALLYTQASSHAAARRAAGRRLLRCSGQLHFPLALDYFADNPCPLLSIPNEFEDSVCFIRSHCHGHADPHVEYLVQLILWHASLGLDDLENRQHLPRAPSDNDIAIPGQHPWYIIHKTAARNVCQ